MKQCVDYTYSDLVKAYREVGIEKGRTVSIQTDVSLLGAFETLDREEFLKAHYSALADSVDLTKGTIVVQTASKSLCNTDKPFYPDKTPSEMGVLTEYFRQSPGAVRSLHPFISYTAVGKDAISICEDVSRHAYGPETPEARLLEHDALNVSIGLHPRFSCSFIHHVELVMGVPYRYVKEFLHPIANSGVIQNELFYLYVWYRQCDIIKDKNVKVFEYFQNSGYEVREATLGRGKIYSYSLSDFYKATTKLLSKDIYAQLAEVPKVKPYTK